MSDSVETKDVAAIVEKKEALFSKKNRRLLIDPFDDNNPITVQVLGVCSALAVTVKIEKALVMAIAVVIVTALSNLIISLLRNGIPSRVRMIVQLVVIAFLVIMVDQALKAFSFGMWKELSVYIGLIITNCIIMGRLEAFAMANKPWPSFLDGLGNGLGYGAILIAVALVRELFGFGEIFGFPLWNYLGAGTFFGFQLWNGSFEYPINGLLVVPASAMFLIGILIWWQRARNTKLVDIS